MLMGYSRKNRNRGGGWLGHGISWDIGERAYGNFRGTVKAKLEVEFPGILVFDLGISKRFTKLCRISRASFFSVEFRRVKRKI